MLLLLLLILTPLAKDLSVIKLEFSSAEFSTAGKEKKIGEGYLTLLDSSLNPHPVKRALAILSPPLLLRAPRANQSVNLNKYNLCKPECPPICRDIN